MKQLEEFPGINGDVLAQIHFNSYEPHCDSRSDGASAGRLRLPIPNESVPSDADTVYQPT
jgi:hypothetical protein